MTVAADYVKGLLSGGEVVLIDTRQHWMALLRFALRPILILAGAALLALLNQWLRFDTLGFINDIIHWVLIIAVVVAVVWLPIDVVRWKSRRYVLTNRRAMRMEGVMRKSSFDSSLEQINDIGMSQSILGQRLGYADLTLLTASDAANETYEQLLDGPQFKKAVLDAKEAIRTGTPLDALPEGFVVVGGTNEASRRADGKVTPAGAASAAAPPIAAEPEPEPMAAEPVAASAVTPEPEPLLQPEAAPEPAPEPVAHPPAAPEPDPLPIAEDESKA